MPRRKNIDYGAEGDASPLDQRLLEFMAARLSGEGRPEDAEALEKSCHAFFRHAWDIANPGRRLIDAWYVGAIAEHLQALFERQIMRLVIAMPPSFAKSLFCSVLFPAWGWARRPEHRWLMTTYGDTLAVRDSLRCRDVITSPWYQSRWGQSFQIKSDANRNDYYANDRGGHRIATTPGGAGTGLKAETIVVDDAHKREEIRSDARREWTIEWWLRTMETRGEDYATTTRLVVGQRLKENDLSGTVLAAKELGYEGLILPMEYEEGRVVYSLPLPDPLPRDAIVPTSLQRARPELRDPRTRDGELLCEQVIDRAGVEALKAALLDDAPGQLQQRPSAAAGTVYRRETFRYFDVVLKDGVVCVRLGEPDDPLARHVELRRLRFFQAIDTAATVKETSAYTAITTFAVTPAFDLLVWHVWRARLLVMELYPATTAFRDGPHRLEESGAGRNVFVPDGSVWPVPMLLQAVEEKSSGIGLIQQAAADGRPFEVLKADGDKVMRSRAAVTLYGAGKVFHKRAAPWLGILEDELLSFPNGAHKDVADTVSYGGIMLTHHKYIRAAAQGAAAYPPGGVAYASPDQPVGMLAAVDDDGRRFVYRASEGEFIDVEFDD